MAFTHGTPKGEHTRQPPRALPGADGEAHVWWWEPPAQLDPADLALLGTEEFRRALSLLAERDAAAFAHNRAAARRALAGLLGIAPETVELGRHRCPGCGDRGHGPPRVVAPESAAPLAISMSRTADRGVFALGAGTTIGVDVETVRPMREASLSGSVLTDNERAYLMALAPGPARDAGFHRVWTRKEAVVKAAGLGLVGTVLNRLETWPAHPGPVRVLHTYAGRTTAWAVQDLRLGDTVAAAVARPHGALARGPVHIHPVPRTEPVPHTETPIAPDPEGT
ncbi:4'-phosphopantetheinyl transferase family protein [Streptomyces liangshanensis]|uniref:4'-phosphopantetheinyl transferase superfamily protein n=1 Tax=Streptomyces liangshanensis TaxID=2717324 RepID=A0A6G9H1R1_9ACTN|nr:4'-phosphopantetheinyl transferase superfamily protein [Streptomyces liangshanensis]QIQ04400.1 4'-phosphopantetheinyl transferase superfamily protein [Streptomyces liangshanensis]